MIYLGAVVLSLKIVKLVPRKSKLLICGEKQTSRGNCFADWLNKDTLVFPTHTLFKFLLLAHKCDI